MFTFEEECAFLRASALELQDYLLSPQLFRQLTPDRRFRNVKYLQFTPGNLLLCEARLRGMCQARQDCSEILALLGQTDQIRERWKTHWRQKIHLEYRNRLESWREILQEAASDGLDVMGYSFNVRLRVILRLLEQEYPPDSNQFLESLDQTLRNLSDPSPFIWEPELEKAFPPDEFWFLYRLPRK